MPFTEKFYTDAEMTQTPPAGTRVIFQGYSNGTASGDKVLRYKDENGKLAGFNVLVGGGLSMEHGNTATYPNISLELGSASGSGGGSAPEQEMAITWGVLASVTDASSFTGTAQALKSDGTLSLPGAVTYDFTKPEA